MNDITQEQTVETFNICNVCKNNCPHLLVCNHKCNEGTAEFMDKLEEIFPNDKSALEVDND